MASQRQPNRVQEQVKSIAQLLPPQTTNPVDADVDAEDNKE